MSNAIEVHNLSHRYGDRVIYENLSFSVPKNRVVALLGKNGVGKTTLIKILMGFLRPVGGRCYVLGEDSHDLSPVTRARIGLLFEGHLAYDLMTIAEIERFYKPFYPGWRSDLYYDLGWPCLTATVSATCPAGSAPRSCSVLFLRRTRN